MVRVRKTYRRKYRRPAKRMLRKKRVYKRTNRVPKTLGPFPRTMNTTLVYKQPSAVISSNGVVNYKVVRFNANGMFDYDYDNLVNNKQPLYFDQLLSIDGPYRQYRVNAFKTRIKFINLSDKALNVYWSPASVNNYTDNDTPTEIQNWKGVSYRQLTSQSNAKPQCTFKTFKKINQLVPATGTRTTQWLGGYGSNPTINIVQALMAETIDGSTTAFNFSIEVEHIFYVQLFDADAIIS